MRKLCKSSEREAQREARRRYARSQKSFYANRSFDPRLGLADAATGERALDATCTSGANFRMSTTSFNTLRGNRWSVPAFCSEGGGHGPDSTASRKKPTVTIVSGLLFAFQIVSEYLCSLPWCTQGSKCLHSKASVRRGVLFCVGTA